MHFSVNVHQLLFVALTSFICISMCMMMMMRIIMIMMVMMMMMMIVANYEEY